MLAPLRNFGKQILFTPLSQQCLSDETLKTVGPFYMDLLSTPGEI